MKHFIYHYYFYYFWNKLKQIFFLSSKGHKSWPGLTLKIKFFYQLICNHADNSSIECLNKIYFPVARPWHICCGGKSNLMSSQKALEIYNKRNQILILCLISVRILLFCQLKPENS